MTRRLLSLLALTGTVLTLVASPSGAHTGHNQKEAESELVTEDLTTYSREEVPEVSGEAGEDLFSPSALDLLSSDAPEPMERMEAGGHGSEKQHIKIAEHQWISSSQKGYGVAVAITMLAGLAFGFLTLKRPKG